MRKFIKINLLVLSLLWFNTSYAAISTKCTKNESGFTECLAMESDINVMNLACSSNESGITRCNGNYTDKTTANFGLSCKNNHGELNCSGRDGEGSSFALNCRNTSADKLICRIADNLDESLTMTCLMGNDGTPKCSGIDNQGAQHSISCNNKDGSNNCITN